MKTILKFHEDNKPLETMKQTPALLWMIKRVREGELELDDPKAVATAALCSGATAEDVANTERFFEECEDAFQIVDVADVGGAR